MVNPTEAGVDLRERSPLSRNNLVNGRVTPTVYGIANESSGFYVSNGLPKGSIYPPTISVEATETGYVASIRDTAKSRMGLLGTATYVTLLESRLMNVGGALS